MLRRRVASNAAARSLFAASLCASLCACPESGAPQVRPERVAPAPLAPAPLASAPPAASDPPGAALGAVSTSAPAPPTGPSNGLTAALARALHAEPGNVFFSAESVRTALGMTALGARGGTLDALSKVLGVDAEPQANAAAARAASLAWTTAAGKSELAIANEVWLDKTFTLDRGFAAAALSGYGVTPVQVDFAQPETSRGTINGWVSQATKGKIRDLLPKGAISSATRVVLTNAVYFKGRWAHAFDKPSTTPAPFHAADGDVTVPMMHRRGDMAYAEDADAQLVELPYLESDMAMLVALPKSDRTPSALAGSLTSARIEGWAKSLALSHVALAMPRFTFTWGRSITRELEAIGLRAVFGGDFSGMGASKGAPATLSDVFHKAFVLVDEAGTEAAAATGVVMRATAARMGPTVTLDRPFLFFVRNAKTGDVLFSGWVSKPELARP
jgi:serpin B